MFIYALIIFTSAFLLFLLQLITAKQILPWFGGSASVWITCLVFYQTVLLFGYAYSDWITRRLAPNRQAIIHVALLAISLALLPLIPDASWKPDGNENPAWRILALLIVTIGLPYFLLSTTSPLIQAWFARTNPGKNPYRLFALSNLASMLALLSYPLGIEPWLTTSLQAQIWTAIYVIFVALCCAAAWHSLRTVPASASSPQPQLKKGRQPKAVAVVPPPSPGEQLRWIALAAMGSFLLLAVTNHLTQNVASVPLLWVLPMSIYLLTFILCFDGRNWYRRNLFAGLLAVMLCAMAWMLTDFRFASSALMIQIGLFSVGLFIGCMFCHGELNRLRPDANYLTRFYLMVALGGALGSILVGIIAPLVLPAFFDLEIGLVLLAGLGLYQLRDLIKVRGRKSAMLWIGAAIILFTSGCAILKIILYSNNTEVIRRNFYGALRVIDYKDDEGKIVLRELVHGTIIHGNQYPDMTWRRNPTTFYRKASGIGRTLRSLIKPNAHIGIIGLGTGTIASYGRPGDVYRFYEIEPAVIQIANSQFTYLQDSAAKIEIVQGDARLNLEREPSQQFDILAVDAFSGDAIPMHLITTEAFDVYLKHMGPDSVIAFHVTNAFLDLVPMVQRLAEAHGLKAAYIFDVAKRTGFDSNWVILSKEQAILDLPYIKEATSPIQPRPDLRIWTDNFSNILQVLR